MITPFKLRDAQTNANLYQDGLAWTSLSLEPATSTSACSDAEMDRLLSEERFVTVSQAAMLAKRLMVILARLSQTELPSASLLRRLLLEFNKSLSQELKLLPPEKLEMFLPRLQTTRNSTLLNLLRKKRPPSNRRLLPMHQLAAETELKMMEKNVMMETSLTRTDAIKTAKLSVDSLALEVVADLSAEIASKPETRGATELRVVQTTVLLFQTTNATLMRTNVITFAEMESRTTEKSVMEDTTSSATSHPHGAPRNARELLTGNVLLMR